MFHPSPGALRLQEAAGYPHYDGKGRPSPEFRQRLRQWWTSRLTEIEELGPTRFGERYDIYRTTVSSWHARMTRRPLATFKPRKMPLEVGP